MAAPRGQGWKRVGPGQHVSTDGQYSIHKGTNWEGKTTWWATHHDPASGRSTGINGWNTLPATKSLVDRHRADTARAAQAKIDRVPLSPEEIAEGTRRLSEQLGRNLLGGVYNDRRDAPTGLDRAKRPVPPPPGWSG